jgi:uncharacterized NAD(P)/FAD-binding protein YdhS
MSRQADRLPGEIKTTEAGRFATRRLYGRYLRALLYEEMTASGGRVRLGADDVVDLAATPDGWRLICASGREVLAAGVVLAAGNLPSRRACDGVVFHDPWASGATSFLRPDEPVLVVGTGLTMVDLVLSMRRHGFAGRIIALSRRGLVPQRHCAAGPAWPTPDFTPSERHSLPALLRRVRAEIRAAQREGIDWRAVIDGLRPVTASLWQGLPPAERDRFLRFLRPYWDVHRHRMAPTIADAFDALRASGTLHLMRGRVRDIETSGDRAHVTVQDRGGRRVERLEVQRVIYATGVAGAASHDRLMARLLHGGLARTDRHGMGLEVTPGLEVVGGGGEATPRLWALGPIVRGIFWECTAVPDIRVQARTIAAEIAAVLALPV